METKHKLAVGDLVEFAFRMPYHERGPYRIVATVTGDDLRPLYRIRGDREPFERMVEEHDIIAYDDLEARAHISSFVINPSGIRRRRRSNTRE